MVPYLVTTAKRGVFFGYHAPIPSDTVPDVLTLKDCRVVVYWSAQTRGFTGLASTGPAAGSRVGNKAPETTLNEITSISLCSPAAAKAFESGVWS